MPRKPLIDRRAEAMFWDANACRLQDQPIPHKPFVHASRQHAARLHMMSDADYKIERRRIIGNG
jgi:hypothetical protein